MAFRRMLPLIILNVIVSAVVVLALLYWWDNRQGPEVLVFQFGVQAITQTDQVMSVDLSVG